MASRRKRHGQQTEHEVDSPNLSSDEDASTEYVSDSDGMLSESPESIGSGRPKRKRRKVVSSGTANTDYNDLIDSLQKSDDKHIDESVIERLFRDLEVKIDRKIGEKFNHVHEKLEEVKLLVARIEVKINNRRVSSEIHQNRKRSRLMSIDERGSSKPISHKTAMAELGLPIKSVEEVDQFENNLEKDDFKNKVFHVLVKINGDGGEMEGGKLIKSLFNAIFTEETVGCYTFTGKNKTTKKFCDLKSIIALIYELLNAADRSYTIAQYERDLVAKVFKYAYRGRKTSQIGSSSTSSNLLSNNAANFENIHISEENCAPSTSQYSIIPLAENNIYDFNRNDVINAHQGSSHNSNNEYYYAYSNVNVRSNTNRNVGSQNHQQNLHMMSNWDPNIQIISLSK